MKKLLLAALILTATQLKAQTDSTSTDSSQVLYSCIDNPIATSISGISADNIVAEITSGDATLSRADDGSYTAKPNSLDPIQIKISNKKTGKTLATIPFRVSPLPQPTITTGRPPRTQRNGEVDYRFGVWATIILPQTQLPCQITSFTLTHSRPGLQPTIIKNKGTFFSDQMRATYAAAQKGDTYRLSEINAICPCDNQIRRLPDNSTTIE